MNELVITGFSFRRWISRLNYDDSKATLKAYKDQYGIEQDFGFLKDPVIVNSIFLKKPERIEVLGLILLTSLLIRRLMERSMRQYVQQTGEKLRAVRLAFSH